MSVRKSRDLPLKELIGAVLYGVLVLWVALTLVFILLRLLPGDALAEVSAQRSQIDLEAQRETLGLNDSWIVQYGRYLGSLVRGDLGDSLVTREAVDTMLAVRLGPTLALGLAAFGVAAGLGTVLGLVSGLETAHPVRKISDWLILISQAVPLYITGLLAIYLFSVMLDLLPASGSSSPLHLLLPALTLGFHSAGSIGRILSFNLRDAYQQPFIVTARAKGLPPMDILDHTLRVALLPTLNILALQAGFLLSGTVIIEVMFVRRGIGSLLYQSVLSRDYPVVQAIVLLGTVIYMVANGISGLARRWLDPRLRYSLAGA